MKPEPIPSGSQRVPQAAGCETERAPGCADTRCGRGCPQERMPSNLKSSGLGGKRRREAYGGAGLELSSAGCPGWGSAPAGEWCAALQYSPPAGILADAARNLPGAARGGMLQSQIHHPEEGVSRPVQLRARPRGEREEEERCRMFEPLGTHFAPFWGFCPHRRCQPRAATVPGKGILLLSLWEL